jgi:signal transduction histidine kinase
MVALIIFLVWIINNTFLSGYYIRHKINNLENSYNEIVNIYNESTSAEYLSEQDTKKVEQLALKYNIDINVLNQNYALIYPAQENFGKRQYDFLLLQVMGYRFPGTNPYMKNVKKLADTEFYDIYSLYDLQMDSNYIDLVGLFHISGNNSQSNKDNTNEDGSNKQNNDLKGSGNNQDLPDTLILLRTNKESIEESVALANEFLAYIGIAVVILGSAIMFIISRKFTKPILEMSDIAKKMSDLDFDAKYKIKTKDELGELGNSINFLSDKLETAISELKQANNELLVDIQKKTEIDDMRKEFLSNVSHELKTPISLIQGYAEGLKENINEDEESRSFYCEVIMDEASKMNQMVKKLLSLNELEFGNNQVNFERFDIAALIKAVLDSTDILFKQKEVILYFDQKEPLYVWADEYLIEQVLTNYISNALNHVSGQKIVEVKLIQRDDVVRVAVFNTGANIPEEEMDKIWVKFYKVDKARTREYGGSGIGLSIVKAIMNSHNMECGVINRQTGVEFWFELDTNRKML